MDTDELMLNRALGRVDRANYVDWATSRLMQGDDSPNLRVLAGLSPRHEADDIEPYFQRTCADLGITPSRTMTPPLDCVAQIRRSYERGNRSALEAIQLMAELYRLTDYQDPLLAVWMHIDEEVGMLGSEHAGIMYPVEPLSDLDSVVRREWDLLERERALNLGSELGRFSRCIACKFVGEPVAAPGSFLKRLLRVRRGGNWSSRVLLCARCGSDVFESLWDPDVRAGYLDELESGRTR